MVRYYCLFLSRTIKSTQQIHVGHGRFVRFHIVQLIDKLLMVEYNLERWDVEDYYSYEIVILGSIPIHT